MSVLVLILAIAAIIVFLVAAWLARPDPGTALARIGFALLTVAWVIVVGIPKL